MWWDLYKRGLRSTPRRPTLEESSVGQAFAIARLQATIVVVSGDWQRGTHVIMSRGGGEAYHDVLKHP